MADSDMWDEMLAEADYNSDGQIDIDEFLTYMIGDYATNDFSD